MRLHFRTRSIFFDKDFDILDRYVDSVKSPTPRRSPDKSRGTCVNMITGQCDAAWQYSSLSRTLGRFLVKATRGSHVSSGLSLTDSAVVWPM